MDNDVAISICESCQFNIKKSLCDPDRLETNSKGEVIQCSSYRDINRRRKIKSGSARMENYRVSKK